jgi:murein endopeptidase
VKVRDPPATILRSTPGLTSSFAHRTIQTDRSSAREPLVERVFVNAAIKRARCREGGPGRIWMAKIRPWSGHNDHFHVGLSCPSGSPQRRGQALPPPGDGCGQALDWWFTAEARPPRPSAPRKNAAAWGPAAGLCRARHGAVRTGAATSDTSTAPRLPFCYDGEGRPDWRRYFG